MEYPFLNEEHKDRFLFFTKRDGTHDRDRERHALFYILAGNEDLAGSVNSIYDFNEGMINTECFDTVDFTSGSLALVKLAFNLYNGYNERPADVLEVLYPLDASNFELAMNAIKIRFRKA